MVNSLPALSQFQSGGSKAEVPVSGRLIISAQRISLQAGCLCPHTSNRAELQRWHRGVGLRAKMRQLLPLPSNMLDCPFECTGPAPNLTWRPKRRKPCTGQTGLLSLQADGGSLLSQCEFLLLTPCQGLSQSMVAITLCKVTFTLKKRKKKKTYSKHGVDLSEKRSEVEVAGA